MYACSEYSRRPCVKAAFPTPSNPDWTMVSSAALRRAARLAPPASFVLLITACGDDNPGFSCPVSGATTECSCPDGSIGEATCLATGVYSVCECEGGADAGGMADTGGMADAGGGADAGGADATAQPWPSPTFFGERQCPYTTATFAGEWSPADTTMETFFVTEVDGGFAVAGVERQTPFGSCEITFDYDGTEGGLRDPQPCTGGIAEYNTAALVVDGDDFSFDVLGQAMGFTVSMQVDCGAGDVSIGGGGDDETGFVGEWACEGTASTTAGASFEAPFTLTNVADGDGVFRASLSGEGQAAPLVAPFQVCTLRWDEQSDTQASLSAATECTGGEGATAISQQGLRIVEGQLVGDVSVLGAEMPQLSLVFACDR